MAWEPRCTATIRKRAKRINVDEVQRDFPHANLIDVNLTDANLGAAVLTGVHSGGIVGTPSALPSGWTLVHGTLVGPT